MTETPDKDRMRQQLSEAEDKIGKDWETMKSLGAVDDRALAIARTHLQTAFMWAKRALYEGKRVGDA